ncbi:NAD(P)/FAD-dependent oxidoreductase [Gluconacetobacter sp. Hr-1-5]|uniref:NAD(P)/FAD-dependent oxidoreductase n=1 Tax=Gluconacetobacter sp. Hr-1-5 TaxID=3395370 RepID=UPI003B51E4C1
MRKFDVLIVGGGHGGAEAAIALRQSGFAGTIALVCAEPELPYERPPLSKEYLAGAKTFSQLLIRSAAFWLDIGIVVLIGTQIVAIDPNSRTVLTKQGEPLSYGDLVWATGGDARTLPCPGATLPGVHSIRNRSDVDHIKKKLNKYSRLVVVGGGYIGLEAASTLISLGMHVTLLESQDRIFSRVTGMTLSRFYETEHRAQGVDIRLGAHIDRIEGNDKVQGVGMADGTILHADMVIAGIGIVPAVAPLLKAGARGGDGVSVDAYGRTSLPHIFAVGDCALHENAFAGGRAIRLESVQNANDMARTVAKTITGRFEPYCAVPWFWSDQYDLRLQTVGLSGGYEKEIVRGDPMSRSFSIIYLKRGRVIALDCINAPKDFMQGKALVANGTEVHPDQLGDPSVSLKAIFNVAK